MTWILTAMLIVQQHSSLASSHNKRLVVVTEIIDSLKVLAVTNIRFATQRRKR